MSQGLSSKQSYFYSSRPFCLASWRPFTNWGVEQTYSFYTRRSFRSVPIPPPCAERIRLLYIICSLQLVSTTIKTVRKIIRCQMKMWSLGQSGWRKKVLFVQKIMLWDRSVWTKNRSSWLWLFHLCFEKWAFVKWSYCLTCTLSEIYIQYLRKL